MGIFQKQAMQEKEMFLKQKNNYFKCFLFFFFWFFFSNTVTANETVTKKNVNNYLKGISQLSAKFIQTNNNEISEGEIFLKNKRIKINYLSPSKITIILTDKKAMYYNEDLLEVEYFSPKETIGAVFYNIFYNKEFFDEINVYENKNYISTEKIIELKDGSVEIKIYFERKPLNIKKIETKTKEGDFKISFSNLNYNPSFKKNFFSMASPILD